MLYDDIQHEFLVFLVPGLDGLEAGLFHFFSPNGA